MADASPTGSNPAPPTGGAAAFAPGQPAPPKPARPFGEWCRRVLAVFLSISFIVGGLATGLVLANELEIRPRTDDAYVRANVIGIAPHVSGPIVELPIVDNQPVSKGDLLFVVDPRPYEVALASAEANLAVVDLEIASLEAQVAAAERSVSAAQAHLAKVRADADYAAKYFERVEPLLAERFVTPDAVDKARSDAAAASAAVAAAEAMVAKSEAELATTIANLGQLGDVNALREAAAVAVDTARLFLDYCFVKSPIEGYITNLNITVGEYANEGQQVFAIVDRSIWYVMANFKETDLPYFDVGATVEIYRLSEAGERLEGVVQGIGWALYQQDGATVGVLPEVSPTLDWVRLAQRFPVRIVIDSEPQRPLRMGETMSVIVMPPGEGSPPPRFPRVRTFFDWLGLDD
jgi:multidrug efflux system membrane fusion protein